jgi:hypothetical protein
MVNQLDFETSIELSYEIPLCSYVFYSMYGVGQTAGSSDDDGVYVRTRPVREMRTT